MNDIGGDSSIEVIGEGRRLVATPEGDFADDFEPYDVHLYPAAAR